MSKMPRAISYTDYHVMLRSGLCPNGCGLMHDCGDDGQHCQACDFMCDEQPDKPPGLKAAN